MDMSKVFAIYPIDRCCSTKFLNRINTFEMRNLGDDWHCYKIHFSDADHKNCLAVSKDTRFILYMGHGGETKLCGSCAKYGEMEVSPMVRDENNDFYNKDVFIDANNISEFKGQIFFCFSCNSNRNTPKSIGRCAIENGVLSFVGFGDIPTDYVQTYPFSTRCIAIYKGVITKVIKHALKLTIESDGSVEMLVRLIQVLTTKEIQNLVLTTNRIRQKESIIRQLVMFKNDIRIFGDRYSRVISGM